jgi:hypothetical protein
MQLKGHVYDFGDRTASEHLRSISEELEEQAFINGEEQPEDRSYQPLHDLSDLLGRLAAEVRKMENVQ